jgi:hypothetical protein
MTASRTRRDGPSKRSLREIPEVDFRTARVRRNRYARRIVVGGLVARVARWRSRRLPESGGRWVTVPLPEGIRALLARRARAKGLRIDAAIRQAILEWVLPAE